MLRRATTTTSRFAVPAAASMMGQRRHMSPPEAFQALQIAKVGEPAPNFSCSGFFPDGKIQEKVGLSNFEGKKLVIVFAPLAWTFVCPTEYIGINALIPKFRELNAEVVGVTVDSHFCLKAWAEAPRKKGGLGGLDYPLLSDITKDISRDYGVLIEDKGIALRGTFILDEEHVLQSSTINNLSIGRNMDEAVRVCQAIDQAKDGNVVPCGWTPGKPLLNVAKAQDFFEKNN